MLPLPSMTTSIVPLALLMACCNAQSDPNANLTLRFFQNPQEKNSCSYSNTSAALTFTTNSYPRLAHCFDISDLFGSNITEGFVNQSQPFSTYNHTISQGINYTLFNSDIYGPSANYSSVLYRQFIPHEERQVVFDSGNPADGLITLYQEAGCSNSTGQEWHGFTCFTDEHGECGTAGFAMKSFKFESRRYSDDYTCSIFSRDRKGNSAAVLGSTQAMSWGLFVSGLVAYMMA
ncbi:hypothetical protein D6D11_08921 [Aureobasidium pullulans]|nr:hypothetical protein D6D11_08921 [Aureobasidium pullulans]